MTPAAWTTSRDDKGFATLTLDVPGRSANTLSSAVLEELAGQLAAIERDPPRGLLIRSGKRSGFIAGADINEFTTLHSVDEALVTVRRGQSLCDRIEALPCPTVALLQGFALGGGMELALACRYRVGVDDGKLALGLPEVQLGIHPGFGGTVRAVRLLGVRPAMDLMLTGRTIRADRAREIGLIDALVPQDKADATCAALLAAPPSPHRPPLLDRLLSLPGLRSLLTPSLLRQVSKRARRDQYPAPFAIVNLWSKHGARGRAAFDDEAESIAGLFLTPTARNLVRVFQLQDRLKSLGGAKDAGTPSVRRVHVVGAGVMGGDIAAWCALRGLDVTLQDRSLEQVGPALKRAGELFAKRLREPAEREAAVLRLRADVEGAGVRDADVVIEAIFEDLDAKHALFAKLEPQLKADALLATNTSSLTLESIASVLATPGRLVGLHFFNPVAQMPLVEIVHAPDTHTTAVNAALAFARRLDRLPLPCRSAPGFLVNRVLAPYLLEALIALEQGVAPELIDAAAKDFGMPMGPVELADVVGLDVCKHVGDIVGQLTGRQPPMPLTRIESRIAAHKLGRKTGEGFYVWRDGKPQRTSVDSSQAPANLQDRLILALVNECRACVREGIVADADLVDAGLIFGAGFAPFRGGPLAWAAQTGVAEVVARLERLAAAEGPRFTPDPGWPRSE
jgi:3-hydroxyacyl-CoA dehydrogenase/enoyl-CoA hydratase/3-hydroxybutyryl-CoA epimerase